MLKLHYYNLVDSFIWSCDTHRPPLEMYVSYEKLQGIEAKINSKKSDESKEIEANTYQSTQVQGPEQVNKEVMDIMKWHTKYTAKSNYYPSYQANHTNRFCKNLDDHN